MTNLFNQLTEGKVNKIVVNVNGYDVSIIKHRIDGFVEIGVFYGRSDYTQKFAADLNPVHYSDLNKAYSKVVTAIYDQD